jgi:hypothetical protein
MTCLGSATVRGCHVLSYFFFPSYLDFNQRHFHQDGLEFVRQAFHSRFFPLIPYYYSPGSQNSVIRSISCPQAEDIQSSLLPLQVTGAYLYFPPSKVLNYCLPSVLRAHNIPRLKTILGESSRFYATVTYGENTWQSQPVRKVSQRVEWNESVDTL